MTGSYSLSASNKFSRYRGSGQVTLVEIMELSGLMEGGRKTEGGKDGKEGRVGNRARES